MKTLNKFSKIEIIDVLDFQRSKVNYCTKKRNFNVLSIRVFGEAQFIKDDEIINVSPQHILLIPKNIEYRQSTEGERVIAIHFKGHIPYDNITSFIANNTAAELFCNIVRLWHTKDKSAFYMAHSKMYEILASISSSTNKNTFKDKIDIGYKEINMRFKDTELKIDHIAQQNGMSGVYFRREFKKRYNTSPKKQLIALRLNNAALLLENGYCSVSDAALQSGFSDPNYFSTVFKKHFNMTPLEYSKRFSILED